VSAFNCKEEHQHARVDELGQAAEVPAKQPGQRQVIDAAGLTQVVQQRSKLPGSMASSRLRICGMSEVSCSCESSGKVRW